MMASLLLRYATPLITGLFLVSLISGVALFFHWGPGAFHGIHEWLSMVLILPFVLHLWKNWRPMTAYFKRAPMAIALGLSLLASLAFFIPLESATARQARPRRSPSCSLSLRQSQHRSRLSSDEMKTR